MKTVSQITTQRSACFVTQKLMKNGKKLQTLVSFNYKTLIIVQN